jgi:hypothetical protein
MYNRGPRITDDDAKIGHGVPCPYEEWENGEVAQGIFGDGVGRIYSGADCAGSVEGCAGGCVRDFRGFRDAAADGGSGGRATCVWRRTGVWAGGFDGHIF